MRHRAAFTSPNPFLRSKLRYVEIYNNVFHNLLETAGGSGGSGSGAGKRSKSPRPDGTTTPPRSPASKIEVREHPSRGVFLSGGRGLRVPVNSAAAVVTLVSHGAKARRTASTGLNDRSSRSHAILILEIEATHSRTALAVRSTSPCRSVTSAPAGAAGGASGGGGGSPKGYRRGRRASMVECVSIGKMQVRGGANVRQYMSRCCLLILPTRAGRWGLRM